MSAIATLPSRPNLNPPPKHRFQESADNISKHREMVESRTFERAIDFALMQYQLLLAAETQRNPGAAAFSGLKATGAVEFVDVLKNLSEMPPIIRNDPPSNLDHKV